MKYTFPKRFSRAKRKKLRARQIYDEAVAAIAKIIADEIIRNVTEESVLHELYKSEGNNWSIME